MKLTVEQMRDILLQKPNRITAGILQKRPLWMKARDGVMRFSDRSDGENVGGIAGFVEETRDKLFLVFREVAKLGQEHPRSLKKAKLELKALGFSNDQIKKLSKTVRQINTKTLFVDQFSDDGEKKNPADVLRKNYPGYNFFWNDDAFMGTGIAVYDDNKGEGYLTSKWDKRISTPKKYNSPFKEGQYDLMDDIFLRYLERSLLPGLLRPSKPHLELIKKLS